MGYTQRCLDPRFDPPRPERHPVTTNGSPRRDRASSNHDDVAQLAELVVRTSWRLRRGTAKELAPLGLTFAQARVMRVLAGAGEPMRMADLAARLEIVPRSMTTMIDSLEQAGLVCRAADANDRRSVLVTPSPAGRAVLDRLDRARRDTADDLFSRLTAGERAQLLTLLVSLDAERGAVASRGH
jgi:DNA-binding MarR family transcriptional regulator